MTEPWMREYKIGVGNKDLRQYVKGIPGSRWDAKKKCWLVPYEMVKILEAYNVAQLPDGSDSESA